MTCLEKFMMENPDETEEYVLEMYCPNASGGIDIDEPEDCPDDNGHPECIRCWNREAPATDPQPTNTTEAVNHPKHYGREGAMECIDEMVMVFGAEATMNFCLLNAWKYRYRAGAKGGYEDLRKSDWYLAKYKELKGGD